MAPVPNFVVRHLLLIIAAFHCAQCLDTAPPFHPSLEQTSSARDSFSSWPDHQDELKQCPSLEYYEGSKMGHRASCPFDWVVDTDPDRLPSTVVHQVCRKDCRSCGHNRHCVQLRVRNEFYYRNTDEVISLVTNAGCVCLPKGVGAKTASHQLILHP